MAQEHATPIVLGEHPRPGRRLGLWIVVIVVVLISVGALSARFGIPLRIAGAIGPVLAATWLLVKLCRDNRRLLKNASWWRLAKSAVLAIFYMIPFSLALVPGILANFALDKGVGYGIDFLDEKVAPIVTKTTETMLEPYPWYDPRHYLGDGVKKTIKESTILKEAPKTWRYSVGILRQMLEAMRVFFAIYLCYVALRLFFYFVARVYVSRGDIVRFTLEAPR